MDAGSRCCLGAEAVALGGGRPPQRPRTDCRPALLEARSRTSPESSPATSRANQFAVIPSERSEPFVIPSERSESRDLHLGFHAETRTTAELTENCFGQFRRARIFTRRRGAYRRNTVRSPRPAEARSPAQRSLRRTIKAIWGCGWRGTVRWCNQPDPEGSSPRALSSLRVSA